MHSKPSSDHREFIGIRIDPITRQKLIAQSKECNTGMSDLIRTYIASGLQQDGLSKDDDRLYALISQAVSESFDAPIKRIAAMTAKATHIGAADFFLVLALLRILVPPNQQDTANDMAAKARQLAIEYIKQKGGSIDQMLAQGIDRMMTDDE